MQKMPWIELSHVEVTLEKNHKHQRGRPCEMIIIILSSLLGNIKAILVKLNYTKNN